VPRNEEAGRIVPVERGHRFVQKPRFHRRVAHHIQQLLVAPDIVFQRRDIEIAHQHHRIAARSFAGGEEFFHLAQEMKLVREFLILPGIGMSPPAGT